MSFTRLNAFGMNKAHITPENLFLPMSQPLLSLKTDPTQPTIVVSVGVTSFGALEIPMIAGPCSVESYEQLQEVAAVLKRLGISCLRGGAFKPRTSPYSFQGHGQQALEWLGAIRQEYGLSVISEVMSIAQIAQAEPYLDCYQVGSRNMQNFDLLKALGQQPKPVLLKRGFAATLDEFLHAAEYILMGGIAPVILCERGIRGFDSRTRNVLDLGSVAWLKENTHLPVVVDPSHATGKATLVPPAAKASVAVGADGLMLEVHPEPLAALSDADQALSLEALVKLHTELHPVAEAIGRAIANPTLLPV